MQKRKRLFAIVIIAVFELIFIFLISKNSNDIDMRNEFNHTEENGVVYLRLNTGEAVELQFRDTDVEIENSYLFNTREEIIEIISFIRYYGKEKGIEIKRENRDLIGECRLHNILYRFGYKCEHTGNANIDYINDERWYVNFISVLIGITGI